jgi:membrane protease subunit (stomatin/prohibitin family)
MAGLTAFNDNYDDLSTDAGFQFTFKCDLCDEGYKTSFIESKTYKKGSFFRNLGNIAGGAADLVGAGRLGNFVDRGSDMMSEKFEGMTPEWHKEHEQAFARAQNEVKAHFNRCPKCKKLVCENDWNEESSLCVECAPRESVEVAAARASKMVEDIQAKAANTVVFKGEINARQALCPKCKKPAGEGKFCSNCGAPLGMRKCSKCGAENASGSFCSECGTKL